jgi:hypothetical protein
LTRCADNALTVSLVAELISISIQAKIQARRLANGRDWLSDSQHQCHYGETAMQAKDFLPDHINEGEWNGVAIRKGTVGAFIVNAKVWTDRQADPAQREIAERDILAALPALRAAGLFDVLAVRDAELRHLLEIKMPPAVAFSDFGNSDYSIFAFFRRLSSNACSFCC